MPRADQIYRQWEVETVAALRQLVAVGGELWMGCREVPRTGPRARTRVLRATLAARLRRLVRREGLLVTVLVDRISDGVLLVAAGPPRPPVCPPSPRERLEQAYRANPGGAWGPLAEAAGFRHVQEALAVAGEGPWPPPPRRP